MSLDITEFIEDKHEIAVCI